MLLIDGSFGLTSSFHHEASRVLPRVHRLAFWEQVTDIRIGADFACLSIENHQVEASEEIVVIRPPRFAKIVSESEEVDFRWAEWNAALNAFLFRRRRAVPNGQILISNAQLADNPTAYLKPFASALRVGCSRNDPEKGGRIWLLATRGGYSTFPYKCSVGLGFDLQASLFQVLEEAGLDYAVLELMAERDRIVLFRVHLVPPSYGPQEVQRSLALFIKGRM